MATPTFSDIASTATTTSTATAWCVTVTPGPHGYVPPEACNAQWLYAPSYPAAIAIAVLFGIATVAHIVLAAIFRKPFCWVIIMGSAWETGAFTIRALGSRDQQNQAYAIVSQILFLLAPLWINAFVYMVAARLVWTYHPAKKIWRLKAFNLGTWFVCFDILCFVIQAAGGLMLNPENDAKIQDIGKKIYMGGTGVQQCVILIFLGLIANFHVDVNKVVERDGDVTKGRAWWKFVTFSLYAVLVLITMRIIFRLVEFSGGMDPAKNRIPYEKGHALGFDASPMALAIFILAVIHPGLALRRKDSEFPTRKQRKAEKKERKEEKRRLYQASKIGSVIPPDGAN